MRNGRVPRDHAGPADAPSVLGALEGGKGEPRRAPALLPPVPRALRMGAIVPAGHAEVGVVSRRGAPTTGSVAVWWQLEAPAQSSAQGGRGGGSAGAEPERKQRFIGDAGAAWRLRVRARGEGRSLGPLAAGHQGAATCYHDRALSAAPGVCRKRRDAARKDACAPHARGRSHH